MYELMVEESFNSAHFLKGYKGNCKNIHGHNYKVQLFVKGDDLDNIGLLADYRILKKELHIILKPLDHILLNDIFDFNPSAELVAKYIYQEYKKILTKINKTIGISKVIVWETERTNATYYE